MVATTQFNFDHKSRRYSIDGPVGLNNARLGIEVDGSMHWADEAEHATWSDGEANFEFAEPHIGWKVRFKWLSECPALLIRSTLENQGKQPVKLGRCRLADTGSATSEVRFGPHPENAAALLTKGAGNPPWWSKSLMQSPDPLVSKTLTQWFSPGSAPALQFGFVTFDRAETVIESRWDKARQVPVVSAWNDFNGFELAPGASVDSEELRIGLESDPLAALDAWADAVFEHYHPPIWPKPPAGWVGWAWVDAFFVEKYEDVVKRNAHAVRHRLKLDENDVPYVWVSVGNIKDILPGNWLEWNYDRFPSGPEALHHELDSLKFRWGLWAGFFWLSSRLTAQVDRLRDALLQYQGKPLTIPHRDLGEMYALDPSHPKTQEFIREVFSTYRRWGVRYYMLDFLDCMSGATPGTHPNDGYFDKSKIPGPEAWREGLRAIRESVTDDTYLLGSTGPAFQVTGLVNGVHLGNDYGDGRPLYGPKKGFYPGTFVINNPDWWTSHHTALLTMGAYSFIHRKLYIADTGSVMTIDKPIALADAQITVTFFGINGSQLMMGDDVDRMDEGRMRMIRLVFPRLPQTPRPLDLFDKAELDYPQLFHLPVEREWDRWDLLAIFNIGKETISKTVPFAGLGLDSSTPYAVWDFWNGRFQGVVQESVSIDVPPRSVKLLRIARDREYPWLLSTDMHVRQGQAEIEDCRWDEASMTLTVRAQRPAGHDGSIYVRAPKGWALAEPKGLWLARDGRDNSLVIRKALAFEGAPIEVQMRFKRFTM
ncbi:MAG: hypothetical protein ABSF45_00550 [Terriglobia bacterium]|jgi:hypothetical protein